MTSITISVPGKVMLSGEYAVLRPAGSSLAFTLDCYLHVHLDTDNSSAAKGILVSSNLWHAPRLLTEKKHYGDMLLDTICELFPLSDNHIKLAIHSDLIPSFGFGSSSALRLALTFAAQWQKTPSNLEFSISERWRLAKTAFKLQQKEQGQASGYDIATQLTGGIVQYSNDKYTWPGTVQVLAKKLSSILPDFVHIFVCPTGAETTKTLQTTEEWLQKEKKESTLMQVSAELTATFTTVLHNLNTSSLRGLIAMIAKWRRLFRTSPCFPKDVDAALQRIAGFDRYWSYKTSGAGGKDALIVVGFAKDLVAVSSCLQKLGWQRKIFKVEEQGLTSSSS